MGWWRALFLLPLAAAGALQKTVWVRDADGIGVREREVALTPTEWSRCLFYNETLALAANRPVLVYDAAYRAMRRLRVDPETWDGLLDLRDDAEELDANRYGTRAFERFPAPVRRGLGAWLERLEGDLREMVWTSADQGEARAFRSKLRALRDDHARWMERLPPASNKCVYFLWNMTIYLD